MTPGVVSRKNDAERLGTVLARNYSRRHFAAIALVYTAIAVVMTWPLMRHPSTTIASDLGDSLFVCWVLMWTSGQVLAALRGNIAALADYWNGNIFYPAPHTIAYSEHFTPQMLQMLPVYAAGGNILLCYNLLFLSTFVIAALGMYSVRPRHHRTAARGVSRRTRVRVRAVSPRSVPASAGHVDRLDAAGAAGPPQILLDRQDQRARRRRRRVRRPGAVVRILPVVFLAALCRVRTLRDDPAPDGRSVARVAASRGGRSRRRARAVSLPAAVSRRSRERRDRRALGGGCRDVRRGHARIRDDRPQFPTARQLPPGVSEARRRRLPGLHDSHVHGDRPRRCGMANASAHPVGVRSALDARAVVCAVHDVRRSRRPRC